ncbi:MAG: alpha/beta fold hydrolase [Thermoplasmata archaeon]|nr:alpha/beta fold hydrolase [Thermoplasmata archaeon]
MSWGDQAGFVRISGHRIYVESYGGGEEGTLLVVPGGPGLGHDYMHPLADLAPLGYRVVLYDPLGCGRSDRPRSSSARSFRHAVNELDALRRALRLPAPVHLLGHSYGGRVVLEAAVRSPDRFAGIVLASPSVRLPGMDRHWGRMLARLPRRAREFMTRKDPRFDDIWEPGPSNGFRRYREGYEIFVRLRVCRMKVPPYDVVFSLQNWNSDLAESIVGSYAAYYGPSTPEDAARAYAKLKVPCLLTVGEYDSIPPSSVRALRAMIPRAGLATFRRSAHLPHWEERAGYVESIHQFLSRCNPGKARGPRGGGPGRRRVSGRAGRPKVSGRALSPGDRALGGPKRI